MKNLSLAEDHFADHFPGYPVMPGPLMLEGLAQTGGILVGEANDFREKVVLAKVPWAAFIGSCWLANNSFMKLNYCISAPEGASVQGAHHGQRAGSGGGRDLFRPSRPGSLQADFWRS